MEQSSAPALLMIDFVNEFADPKGKLAGKGYADFLERHDTMTRVAHLLAKSRAAGLAVFHVRIGFSEDYCEQPEQSPLFGAARRNEIFKVGTWGTEFHPLARPLKGERIILKHRVNAFHGTPLDLILRRCGISDLTIAGIATDLAVQSAARDAHDRDYRVTIVGDCCASSNDRDHADALRLLSKIAGVRPLAELEL